VVIGFFCLVTVASWVQDVTGVPYRLNAIVGGIGLSLAVIPIVFSIAEDALSAVPKTLREASLALGSTEWQTAYRVMLPAAAPGVFAAVLLGIGRAFGETMIAIMATGNAPLSSFSPFEPARTVAATIGSEMGEVVWGSEHYGVLFLLGVLLFVFSFGLNAVTELYVKTRFIKRFQGK
jgi:phosphate transport system permease protein